MMGKVARARANHPLPPPRTRDDILAAAARAFARFGVDNTPLGAVSAEAGCDAASVTAHFADHREIHDAMLENVRREAAELFLLTLPDDLPIRDKLRLLLIHQATWGDRNRDAIHVCGHDDSLRRGYLEGTARWLSRHNAVRELNMRVDTETAAHLLQSIQRAFYERWLARGAEASFVDNVPHVLAVFLGGVAQD